MILTYHILVLIAGIYIFFSKITGDAPAIAKALIALLFKLVGFTLMFISAMHIAKMLELFTNIPLSIP